MATLERKKRPAEAVIIQQQDEIELHHVESTIIHHDDLTNDPILESLSKEPMEYATCCLSIEVVQSLQSVKHICLNVLDLLLLQIVQDLPPRNHQRRLSDTTAENLLGSITQNTNLLQRQQCIAMVRSKSSPPATNISDVYRILDSNHHGIDNQNYTLCCSLAALLNDVYRLLELNSSSSAQLPSPILSTMDDVSMLQKQLHDKVSNFQRKRAAGIMTMDESDASQEMIMIWDEMNHLMNIVSGLAIKQNPPTYEDTPPPAYDSITTQQEQHVFQDKKPIEKQQSPNNSTNDLDKLLGAIDRLSRVAPRLNNQRVDLTERQVKELAAATLGKTVERLLRGRIEDQRALLPVKSKGEVLQDLIQQIHKSASRSLDNQSISPTTQKQRRLDMASLCGVLDRLDKKRYTDQDWISHEELLVNDLAHTTDQLVKSLNRPAYNRQRFSMSAAKERNLSISSLFNKVESLEGYRLVNQDAELPVKDQHQEKSNEDLYQLLDHIYKSKPQLDNQRASFS